MVTRIEKAVVDTSIVIEGLVSRQLNSGELEIGELIIPEAVLAELEHQANEGKSIGFVGLDELKKLQDFAKKGWFAIRFAGRKPNPSEIRYSHLGEVDALIRQLAWEEDATLLTSDKIQAEVAKAKAMKLFFVPKLVTVRKITLEGFFDPTTMSVHLRENVPPMAKRGKPGAWTFDKLRDEPVGHEEVKGIADEIVEEARSRRDGFIEIEREGSTIVQLGMYRIVITKPPFSDGWEITAVRPVKKLVLDDYHMSEKLKTRIAEKAEGILIAGAPGNGKSTFAQALAEHYASQGKIVKTIEAPRDLILPETITQYSKSRGTNQEIHDVLLLSRPDYSVFDEMRNTEDFILFTDLRLSGIGLAGVIHATRPVDAIQRFVGKIELGVIPQVIDTVIFIKDGGVGAVLSLQIEVKVPAGMTEEDLARPVVTVDDFESGKPMYELYSYGEETVVVPVKEGEGKGRGNKGARSIAAKSIERSLQKYADIVKVELQSDNKAIVYVPENAMARIIGKGGSTVQELEDALGIGLDIRSLDEYADAEGERKRASAPGGKELGFEANVRSRYVELHLGDKHEGKDVHIYVNGNFLATLNVGKDGTVRVKSANPLGKSLLNAIQYKEKVQVFEG